MIEDLWKDDVIYYVEFITKKGRKISKMIVLDANYSMEDARKIVLENFKNVVRINHIDVWDDCLTLR